MFIMIALGIIGRKDIVWAIFPAMGAIIGLYFTLAVYYDGQITCPGCTSPLASAAASSATDWSFVVLVPLVFTLGCLLITLYKIGEYLR